MLTYHQLLLYFGNKFKLDERKEECDKLRSKYPDRIPVIVERSTSSKLQELDKQKYIII